MFKWVHLVDAFAVLLDKICRAICNVFRCPDHDKEDNNND